MRLFSLMVFGMMLLSGCKKNAVDPPGKAVLTEPAKNSECTPVQSSSDSNSLVRFRWQPAAHSDSYELHVTNLTTGNSIIKNQRGTTETVSLEKGAPFAWFIVSKNAQTADKVFSTTWLFYNPGTQTNYVPFPAEIIAPEPGATVFKDINNEVTLQWSGADIDNDIESYKIYFSIESPPNVLIASAGANETTQKVVVISDTVYYWRIVTSDALDNTSDTGILDFRVY